MVKKLDTLFDHETMNFWKSLIGASGHEINYGPYPVYDEKSVNQLLAFAGGFHDATIKNVEYSEDKKNVTLFMNNIWGVEVLILIFEGIIDIDLTKNYKWVYFFSSSIFFPNENEVAFAEGEASSVEGLEGSVYVRARKMYFTFDYNQSNN